MANKGTGPISVFEVVDYTDPDIYYPLAIYLDLEKAIMELVNFPKDRRISEISDGDYEKIEIKERKAGWSANGDVVFTMEREKVYDEDKDDYYWKSIYEIGEAKDE